MDWLIDAVAERRNRCASRPAEAERRHYYPKAEEPSAYTQPRRRASDPPTQRSQTPTYTQAHVKLDTTPPQSQPHEKHGATDGKPTSAAYALQAR